MEMVGLCHIGISYLSLFLTRLLIPTPLSFDRGAFVINDIIPTSILQCRPTFVKGQTSSFCLYSPHPAFLAGLPALHPSVPCRLPALHPVFILFAGLPPCNPATPFEKGVDPKTFSVGGQHTFYGKAKNPECRNRCFSETGLWIPVAVPSVGVLCSRAWREASSESPWVFGDASRLHDLKRPSLFRRDEVPARNTPDCPASPLRPEKSF